MTNSKFDRAFDLFIGWGIALTCAGTIAMAVDGLMILNS